ncbi:hypothetical protein BY458DRAFT_431713 [Sporodiniella umbellata]|nr:hypothetical protein BY458DRAFT_431713 [Sporodiniella umbellata]
MSEQEKIEKRRARRQQKILASAESRLHKITGSPSAFRESPTPSPSTSVSSLSEPLVNTVAEHYPPPSDPRRQKYEERPISKPQQHRPAVQKMIEEEQARELSENGFLGGMVPQLLIVSMLRRTNPQERMQKKARHPINKYWNLLHFISMAWLGLCTVYKEWSVHGTDGVSHLALKDGLFHDSIHFEYRITDESTFSSIASQLPISLQSSAYFAQKYGVLANNIFRDLCIVVFVIGFTSLIAAFAC